MLPLLQHRRLTSLIVSLAILLNLCAPALGQAMTMLAAEPLTLDICSATPASEHTPAKLPAHSMRHCVFCAAHAGGNAPPAAEAGLLSVLQGHDAYPLLTAAAQPPTLHWSSAQPRGPPIAA